MNTNYLIETINLNYTFPGGIKTLDGINLQVEKGKIYGFLGPNGSGKTTTLRLLLGLLKKQEGNINLFGEDIETNRVNILKKTGSLIEMPSVYGHLTARNNLNVYRSVYGASTDCVDAVLETVGLDNTENKKAKNFSLGMKQRLALAIALLPKPELLILDEPTNGLDPEGIMELRELIINLNRTEGLTILISSHILSEVEKMVSHVGIISGGRMLFQGSLQELSRLQNNDNKLMLRTSDNVAAFRFLSSYDPEMTDEGIAIRYKDLNDVAAINRKLVNNNIDVHLLQPKENNLEQLYRDLTSNQP